MAYPRAKKWTLVYEDRLTRWKAETRRRAASNRRGPPEEEDPETANEDLIRRRINEDIR
jgi:hypothetical protein